jgi:hypothetical protein
MAGGQTPYVGAEACGGKREFDPARAHFHQRADLEQLQPDHARRDEIRIEYSARQLGPLVLAGLFRALAKIGVPAARPFGRMMVRMGSGEFSRPAAARRQ